jgi:glycosyltransferase involved in cell wall biosynthesis
MLGRRVRVAFCIDTFDIGGTELNAVRTAESLDRSDFDLRIFHLQADGPLRSRYEQLDLPLKHIPISGFHTLKTQRAGFMFAQNLRDWDADILHAHDVYTNVFAAPWARLLTHSKIIASRRWWHATPRAGLPTLNRVAYRLAHKVLANSKAVANMLVAEERVPPRKIVVIPNFLDDEAFAPSVATDVCAQRKRWNIPTAAFVIGMVARLAQVKNHALVIRCLTQLPASTHLVLVGAGPEEAALRLLAKEHRVEDRVHFVGAITGNPNLHRMFDVSVLASTSEGFPNSLLEAMAASRPVIATAVGGVLDVVTHDETGLLVPSNDGKALAAAIARLHAEPKLSERLGRDAHALVHTRYRRESVLGQLANLYHSLARPNAEMTAQVARG